MSAKAAPLMLSASATAVADKSFNMGDFAPFHEFCGVCREVDFRSCPPIYSVLARLQPPLEHGTVQERSNDIE
jgi:hypothetical protein